MSDVSVTTPWEPGPGRAACRLRVEGLLAEGHGNRAVADAPAIMRKPGLTSLAELVRYAIRNQIIEP